MQNSFEFIDFYSGRVIQIICIRRTTHNEDSTGCSGFCGYSCEVHSHHDDYKSGFLAPSFWVSRTSTVDGWRPAIQRTQILCGQNRRVATYSRGWHYDPWVFTHLGANEDKEIIRLLEDSDPLLMHSATDIMTTGAQTENIEEMTVYSLEYCIPTIGLQTTNLRPWSRFLRIPHLSMLEPSTIFKPLGNRLLPFYPIWETITTETGGY